MFFRIKILFFRFASQRKCFSATVLIIFLQKQYFEYFVLPWQRHNFFPINFADRKNHTHPHPSTFNLNVPKCDECAFIRMLYLLIDNIFVVFSCTVVYDAIGISMSTNCARACSLYKQRDASHYKACWSRLYA